VPIGLEGRGLGHADAIGMLPNFLIQSVSPTCQRSIDVCRFSRRLRPCGRVGVGIIVTSPTRVNSLAQNFSSALRNFLKNKCLEYEKNWQQPLEKTLVPLLTLLLRSKCPAFDGRSKRRVQKQGFNARNNLHRQGNPVYMPLLV